MNAGDVVLLVAIGVGVAALIRLVWKAGTVSAFVAGAAAAGVVAVDRALLLVAAIAIGAIAAGGVFATRTRGQVTDEKQSTSWTSRMGAGWLVLSFPAVITWSSLQAAHWMLYRV